jgi:hypothetical protein
MIAHVFILVWIKECFHLAVFAFASENVSPDLLLVAERGRGLARECVGRAQDE